MTYVTPEAGSHVSHGYRNCSTCSEEEVPPSRPPLFSVAGSGSSAAGRHSWRGARAARSGRPSSDDGAAAAVSGSSPCRRHPSRMLTHTQTTQPRRDGKSPPAALPQYFTAQLVSQATKSQRFSAPPSGASKAVGRGLINELSRR